MDRKLDSRLIVDVKTMKSGPKILRKMLKEFKSIAQFTMVTANKGLNNTFGNFCTFRYLSRCCDLRHL